MLTCLALVAFNVAALGDIPKLTGELETEARALAAADTFSADLVARIQELSTEAEALSVSLHRAGVGQDMPCIFQGIANDARERAAEFTDADTQAEQDAALMNMRVLMDDVTMLAPLAAAAAADRAEERNIAQR